MINKHEILNNILFSAPSLDDIDKIATINSNSLPVSKNNVIWQFNLYNGNLANSIKCYDKRDNNIYGLLLLANIHINQGSPLPYIKYDLSQKLSEYSMINGFSFVVDNNLRGTNIHKLLLKNAINYVKNFDYIWFGVDKRLKSINYWKRMGFINVLSTEDADFFMMNTNLI